jgi:hypothetical protein
MYPFEAISGWTYDYLSGVQKFTPEFVPRLDTSGLVSTYLLQFAIAAPPGSPNANKM